MAEGSFIRVFHEDLREHHAEVWNDPTLLGTFVQLLARADKLWPTPADLPRQVDDAHLQALVKSKLVKLLPDFCYQIKGLDKLRQARQKQTEPARLARLGQSGEQGQQQNDQQTLSQNQSQFPRARGRSGLRPSGSDSPPTAVELGTLRAQGPLVLPVKGMNGQATTVRVDEDDDTAAPELIRLAKLAADLTGQPFVNPYNGFMQKALAEQLQPHGFDRVERAWRKVAALHLAKGTARPTLRQLVIDADDILNPLLDRRDVEQAGRAEEEAERQRRRDEANRRRNDEYRVMAGMKPAGKPEPEPA